MRYLAININYELDQDWYFKCTSVLDCYDYFDRLGPGDGPRSAIYDTMLNKYLWVDEKQHENMGRINAVVFDAMKQYRVNF